MNSPMNQIRDSLTKTFACSGVCFVVLFFGDKVFENGKQINV